MRSACALFFCLLAVSSISLASAERYRFTPVDFLNTVEGLLEGIGAAENWTDVQPCVESSVDAIKNVATAIQYFEKETAIDVAYGLAALGKAFEDIPTAITSCVASAKDVEVLVGALEAISSPYSYAFVVAKNLLVNGVDIYNEIYTAVGDFNSGNYKDFGYNVGEALAKVFFYQTTRNMTGPALKFSLVDFETVAYGVLEGIGAAENWTDLQPCISSTEDAIQNIEKAIYYLQKEDTIDVAFGLAALGKALSDLPTSIKSCGALYNDVDKLIHSLAAISSPTTFIYKVAKNIIINGVDIYHEISAAVNMYKSGNWEQFGVNIGKALAQVFLYGTAHRPLGATSGENILVFLEGVLEGISTDANFDQIAPCVFNASSVAVTLDQAVNDFVSEETERVLEGVALLGEALYAIPAAIKECGVAYTQLQSLISAISQLDDPRTIVYHIARSLVINGQETWDKVTDCTNNINAGNYEEAGKAVGAILAAFIEPDAQVSGLRFTKLVEKTAPFKVDHNHRFVNWTRAELKSLFGTKLQKPEDVNIPVVNTEGLRADFPASFISWEAWPECAHPILDQAHCGSCWAFGAAEALSDRFCIASRGRVNHILSPQYLVSCSTFNMGCNGGMLTAAWASLERSGLPTLECTPYQSQSGDSPSCSTIEKNCSDGSPLKKYYAKSWSTRWYMSVDSIKAEIFANGPLESAFTVYEDFMSYKGGVYKHTTGAELGGHAIKIIGWGNEDGQDYWLVANSWGTSWGENGYFKMAIGTSAMDYNGVAGQADLSNLPSSSSFPREFLTY
eukprot:CAMPEP_0176451048 /NCGR_PEP_ID=MMETSP0127-20121128/27561_1 /TAXON_ID=938130 /ORGANISM="Platyophrya macrostoma, Strain WH" /LENGTH=791 /DNA_ID=CAMNT_0017838943 /DNA_START=26 /DNA_END=2401 /DNA_ORIENTATION=+